MFLRIGYEFQFELTTVTPMLLMLHAHPEQAHVLQRPEVLRTDPELPVGTFTDAFGNCCARLIGQPGKLRITYDNVAWDPGTHEPRIDGQHLHRIEELPDDVMPYLLGSRYCEVDRLGAVAWDLFGKTPATWERVQAVMDWVHRNVTFGYKFARVNKTAYDVWYERKGVCRDFQHLAITLMRALNIPARYATGYLGDIGVPADGLPMDFSAWMEVYLGGRWWTLDARHNTPRIGRVLMARGRDATDVALTTSFGAAKLEKFLVHMDEVADDLVTPIDSFKMTQPTPPAPSQVPVAA
ncbi:MAG TPA: transglutaminase family protein [Tepidisphaeraceae bacterium]|nr:transglutaminase family protein [Tepidisphaeraceae bacterium]